MRSRLAIVLGLGLLAALTCALVLRPAWLGFDEREGDEERRALLEHGDRDDPRNGPGLAGRCHPQ